MKNLPKIKASTQEHLDIEDITDDLVILKTGWVALVMSTTAVNFDLLSEAEQDATIYAYGAFLNSLSFPLEILIRSKKADITAYFRSLEEAERNQPNPDLKRQIQKYKDFIQSTVQQKTVLDKKFYLIINYSPLELGVKNIGKKAGSIRNKVQLATDAKTMLIPKRDHVIKQTARLGLNTKQLTTQELIELFYDIYNPAPTGTQRVLLDTASYATPLVEPALEVPSPAPTPPMSQQPRATSFSNPNQPSNTISLRPIPNQNPATSPTTQLPNSPDIALKNLQQAVAKASREAGQAQPPQPQPTSSPGQQTQSPANYQIPDSVLPNQTVYDYNQPNQSNQLNNPTTQIPDNLKNGTF